MKYLLRVMFVSLTVFLLTSVSQAKTTTTVGNTTTITDGGLTVSGTQPTTTNSTVNDAIKTEFINALSEAYDKLLKYSNQPKLAEGFANSNAFASQAATQQGYQDYTLFAVTTGVMASAQFPSYNRDYYSDIDEKIKDEGDMDAGIGASVAMINLGVNAGFVYPGLYLNAKFGYISLNDLGDKVSVKNMLIGAGANYTWIQTRDVLHGLAKWRGISFGTGLLYNYNKTDVRIEMDEIEKSVSSGGTFDANLVLDPTFKIGVESHTFLIPVDVLTSFQLLWVLNFTLGGGIDFTFGSTDIKLKSDGDVTITQTGGTYSDSVTPGSFDIKAGTKDKKPSFVHPRINSGIGFNISVVKIDVPVIYYPIDKALAVGVTAGVVY